MRSSFGYACQFAAKVNRIIVSKKSQFVRTIGKLEKSVICKVLQSRILPSWGITVGLSPKPVHCFQNHDSPRGILFHSVSKRQSVPPSLSSSPDSIELVCEADVPAGIDCNKCLMRATATRNEWDAMRKFVWPETSG